MIAMDMLKITGFYFAFESNREGYVFSELPVTRRRGVRALNDLEPSTLLLNQFVGETFVRGQVARLLAFCFDGDKITILILIEPIKSASYDGSVL